jgi:hypothetical protein
VARASSPSFLRALPAKLESTRTRAESLGAARPPPTRRPPPTSPRGAYPEAARVLNRPTALGETFRPASSKDLRPARFCGKLARSTSSPPASSTAATATDALWGSTPIKTFMSARTSVSVEPLPLAREGHSDFGPCSHTSFESLRTPRSPAGREPRTSQPISWATGSSGAIPITGDLEA